MQIIAGCPRCGTVQRLNADAADKRIRCSKCRKIFKIPKLQDLPKATRIIQQAKGTLYVDQNGKTYG